MPKNANPPGAGKAHPMPMHKTHEGLGNHKQVLRSNGAVKSNAPGSPKTTQNGGSPKS